MSAFVPRRLREHQIRMWHAPRPTPRGDQRAATTAETVMENSKKPSESLQGLAASQVHGGGRGGGSSEASGWPDPGGPGDWEGQEDGPLVLRERTAPPIPAPGPGTGPLPGNRQSYFSGRRCSFEMSSLPKDAISSAFPTALRPQT